MSQLSAIEAKLFPAVAGLGYQFGQDHKDAILGAADSVVDAWQDKVVTAIINNLPSGGIKTIEWGGVKAALLASEPNMDQATNDAVSKLFDTILAQLDNASKQ